MDPGAIITLTRDDDEQQTYELLDWIEFAGEEYAVLLPVEEDADRVVILQRDHTADPLESYIGVENDRILARVFSMFQYRSRDRFPFRD